MTFAGVKTTPVKKILNSKSSLFCLLCEDNVVVSSRGYYRLASDNAIELNIRGKISVLFELEDNLFFLEKLLFEVLLKYTRTEITATALLFVTLLHWALQLTASCMSNPGNCAQYCTQFCLGRISFYFFKIARTNIFRHVSIIANIRCHDKELSTAVS